MVLTDPTRSRVYPAPSPQGDVAASGLKGLAARRPLTVFLVITLGFSWLILAIPVLAFYHVIPGADLPVEIFALAATLLVLLPAALWVTWVTDGRAGLRALFARVFRWRFGIGWWAVVVFGQPVIALLLGVVVGGSLHTAGAGAILLNQLLSILLAVVVINLWEETVWAGFFQTRLEARFNFVVAALLSALPFAGVHLPLLLLDDHVTALSVLKGIGGLLALGMAVRLMIGVVLRAAADSVLAVGILHQIFDASNNRGGLVDSLLDGVDATVMAEVGTLILTVAVVAILLVRRGRAAFAKRQTVRVASTN
jgi:membrane protease YdiL (CAAX protease family)